MTLLPWAAYAAHNTAAVREGLRIVRKVIARDAAKTPLSTTEIYKLALKEPPPPTFSATIPDDSTVPEHKYARSGRRRIPAPEPPHPRHPVRSISFLKHRLLPVIEGEQCVRHVREKRMVFQPIPEMKPRPARGGGGKQQAAPPPATPLAPVETTVWLWRASRPPVRVPPPPPPPPPNVYDFSHMKPSKRKAHRARQELAAKHAVLRERRETLRAEARKKVELEQRAVKRAEGRVLHEATEKAALAEKERKRKEWAEKNPQLARALAKKRAEAEQKLAPVVRAKPAPPSKPKPQAPSKKLRAA
ncbi:hypothetical protein B0H11DRAFT_2214342 [Mycena galericulata]|nr:hypothetical protein B0H11DRAFT_2214342 [Mycena galericulata]